MSEPADHLRALPQVQEWAAARIAEAWRAALRLRYPDREFLVRVADDPEDYGPTLYLASA